MEVYKIVEICGYAGLGMLLLMGIEFIYSYIKKDGVYDPNITLTNMVSGLYVLRFISDRMDTILFTAIIFFFYTFLGYPRPDQFSWIQFIFCLFLVDFVYYVSHRLHHKFRFLWMIHSVHHSDHRYNMSTYLRASVIQQLYGGLLFIPILATGIEPKTIVAAASVLFVYQFICHSSYITFPTFLGYVLILPQIHKIHHDQEMKHQMSNYGSVFSIWDRMFGTYVPQIATFTPGIKGYAQTNIIKIQTDPIVEYWRELRGKKS